MCLAEGWELSHNPIDSEEPTGCYRRSLRRSTSARDGVGLYTIYCLRSLADLDLHIFLTLILSLTKEQGHHFFYIFKRNANAFSLNAIADIRRRLRRRHEMIFLYLANY